MLIQYRMATKSRYHAGYIHEVEMYGCFNDLNHFNRFKSVEETYNRFILSYRIMGQN